MKIFAKGHLSEKAADFFGMLGVCIIFAVAYFFDDWSGFWFWVFALLGAALGYIGAYGGLARKFGFPAPFTNDPLGWRKAKQTYKSDEEVNGSTEKTANHDPPNPPPNLEQNPKLPNSHG